MPDIDILCIGDLDVDMFVSVPAIPGFDQKTSGIHHGRKPGGMSANCAVAASRLGLRSRLVAAVGDDDDGHFIAERIATDGVDTAFLAWKPGVGTFLCLVLLSPSGEKSLIRLETAAYLPSVDDLVPGAFQNVGHLHLTFGSPDVALLALERAAERSIATSLDLEPPDIRRNPGLLARVLPMVGTLFLNREAHELMAGVLGEPLRPGHLKGNGEIVVTLGADGARLISGAGIVEAPGFPVTPLDTTGAGDCFASAYLAARMRGEAPAGRLRFANAAAALATLAIGAQSGMPTMGEVEALMRGETRRASHG